MKTVVFAFAEALAFGLVAKVFVLGAEPAVSGAFVVASAITGACVGAVLGLSAHTSFYDDFVTSDQRYRRRSAEERSAGEKHMLAWMEDTDADEA